MRYSAIFVHVMQNYYKTKALAIVFRLLHKTHFCNLMNINMKNIFTFIILLIPMSAFSQAAFVGIEYQTKTGELLNGQRFDLGYRAGYAMIEEFDKGLFKIEFSAAYKGAKFNLNGTDAIAREWHLDANFNSQWRVKNLFNLGGGAYLTRALFSNQTDGEFIRNVTNQLGFDMGFVGIVGKEFGRFLVEARYRKGVFNTGSSKETLRANDFGVYLFYRFIN